VEDLGYWAPDGDLVFYYDSDAPFFNGIVRIGQFDGDMDALERQSEDFSVTIERGGITHRRPLRPRESLRVAAQVAGTTRTGSSAF
jgi:hypothetical protein